MKEWVYDDVTSVSQQKRPPVIFWIWQQKIGQYFFQFWRHVWWTHTHTRLTALCPGLPGWAGTRKVKPIWILLKQETVSGSGISWMQVCTSIQTDNHASTPPLSFLWAGYPSCRPTNSVKALKAWWTWWTPWTIYVFLLVWNFSCHVV